jgi:hypothetical protein
MVSQDFLDLRHSFLNSIRINHEDGHQIRVKVSFKISEYSNEQEQLTDILARSPR